MQTSRLFEIIYILLGKETVTARKLAERFSVSTRTIYRDIDVLSLAGIPVYTEKGKGGGISLLPDFVLNKSLLSEKDQNEILSALQGLASVKTDETDNTLQKLSVLFNKSAVNWLEVDFSDWCVSNDYHFNNLKTAILERRITEFDYYSTNGEKTKRRIEPIQIWFKSRSWYIKGYCLMRQDLRTFKLVRVKNLKVTDEIFAERDLLKIPVAEEPQYNDVGLKLKVEPEMAYRIYDQFDESLVEQQPDGSYIISVTWQADDWMHGVILSFGEYIEVLEPDHIRKEIREKARKLVEKNS